MQKTLGRFDDRIYALVRIVVGFLFLCHGVQKIFFAGGPPDAMPAALFWAAGGIGLVAGAMIALGILGSWAAFIASGQMAAAYFMAHQPNGILPIQNQGELAVLYCWIFLLMAARGSGCWSLDALRGSST